MWGGVIFSAKKGATEQDYYFSGIPSPPLPAELVSSLLNLHCNSSPTLASLVAPVTGVHLSVTGVH